MYVLIYICTYLLKYGKYWAGWITVGIYIVRQNINNLRYAEDITLMAESEKDLDSLDESKRGEWKSWFKIQHSEN